MSDEAFDISLKKAVFNMVPTSDNAALDLIRWGAFEGKDGAMKIAAFKVSMLDAHFSHEAGKDLVGESDAITRGEEAQAGAAQQAYEWSGDGFEPVDVASQDWFKFS